MKKAGLALVLLLVLSSVIFGGEVNKVVKASAVSTGWGIISPTNSTYATTPMALNVVTESFGASNIFYSMTYSLDGKGNVSFSSPVVIQLHNNSFQVTISGTTVLPKLPEGSHRITVYTKQDWQTTPPHTFVWSNGEVYFTVDDGKPPVITVFSPENTSYVQKDLSLNFTTDEPVSWLGYNLDGYDNVTIAGNTTLTDLPYKGHNVTIYAQDPAGNIGSQSINFTVSEPKTPVPPVDATIIPVSTIIVIFVISVSLCVSLLLYRKHRKTTNLGNADAKQKNNFAIVLSLASKGWLWIVSFQTR